MVLGVMSTIALTASATSMTLTAANMPATVFEKCTGSHRIACVIDGDTLWIDGTKVRVADIDAPEISEPKCASELALGNRATERLIQLINQGPFEMRAWPGRDKDRYGRALRVLVRNGHSLGDVLVSEGLARTWTGRREPWC
jgi:endonuclease YncB( thermonuclease family)